MTSCDASNWGRHPHRLLSLEEAWGRIAAEVRPVESETLPLAGAGGRVLASPIPAADDHPAFDKAMMDGFAVRSADCAERGATLDLVGIVAAGQAPPRAVGPGQAMRINTGAPVPPGADAVVRVEDATVLEDDRRVTINTIATAGRHIAGKGTNRKKHEIVLTPPVRLDGASLAAAATAGAASVEVYREVSAAIVSTGDELVPVGGPCKPSQIFESNGLMLASLVRQFGARPVEGGIVPDDADKLATALHAAMDHPVVMAVGGMSMGTLDLVPQALTDVGVTWRFHGVGVRPGKPIAYGRGPNGQHVFGLPGNPVSAFVCSWLFVRMVIRGLVGYPVAPPPRWRAVLTKGLDASRDARPAFLPARVWNAEGRGMVVEPCDWSGSGDPFGLALANALLTCETPTRARPAGTAVDVILITSDI